MNLLSRILTNGLEALHFDPRTIRYLKFDLRRAIVRLKNHRRYMVAHQTTKLHLGCGQRHLPGWLNCDIADSDFDIDLSLPPLPFSDGQFTDVLAQQFIEHLEYDPGLLNFLKDLHRVMKPYGRIWLSCPDLESICKAYVEDRCATIDWGLKRHWPHASAKGFPTQHRINFFFHQWGEHRNLYDLEMVTWALHNADFNEVRRVSETDLIQIYPEIPPRENDTTSLIVSALRV